MGAQHTPAPWLVVGPDDEPYGPIRIVGKDRTICRLWQDDAPVHDFNDMQWANARLIAACPTMFSFIETCAADGDVEAALILENINASR